MSREQGHNWQFGYTFFDRQTETHDRFTSEKRRQECLEGMLADFRERAARVDYDPKKRSWELGSKCVAGLPKGPGLESETRERYQPRPKAAKTENFNYLGVELKKAHIDHAYGQDKSCKHWQGVGQEEMSRMAQEKYTSGKPQGLGHLGAELRKSSLVLADLPSEGKFVRKNVMAKSEVKEKFVPKEFTSNPSYAATLGKDLRQSHFDINHEPKNTLGWMPQTKSTMVDNLEAKWNCRQPEGFEALGVELRKSSVPLAGSGMTYMMQPSTGPSRPSATTHPRRAQSMSHLLH